MTNTPDVTSARIKILAYLGELRPGEFVSSHKLVNDLSLRFTTAKNILTILEQEWIVEKKIEVNRRTEAFFRLTPTMNTITPEWKAEYGKHPSSV